MLPQRGGAVLASPVFAQDAPTISWRLASSFPTSADAIYNGSVNFAKHLAEATDGKFKVSVHHAGEVVPALQVLDAVQNNTVQCGHSAAYYYYGKDPALSFDAAVPFGLNTRQYNAWMRAGNGLALTREVYKKFNIVNFPCGHTGTQMGGWFRKEINSVEDLKGLKMRCSAFAGAVLSRLGVIPQQVAGGDIYPSLEKGTIDAAEWIGPYDDEKLGLNKVAPYYYTPGWFEGSAALTSMVNKAAWEKLPDTFKIAFETASNEQYMACLTHYDALNPKALRELIAQGAKLSLFPKDVMDAAYQASQELWEELAGKNADFAKIYPQWKAYQKDQAAWFRVAESPLDNFTFRQLNKDQ